MATIGTDEDELPKTRDYRPSRRFRWDLFRRYRKKNRSFSRNWPLILLGFLVAVAVAALAAGVMATVRLWEEGYSPLIGIIAVFVPGIITYISHFNSYDKMGGYFLVVPAILIWGIVFGVTRTSSSFWILITAVIVFGNLLLINTQAR